MQGGKISGLYPNLLIPSNPLSNLIVFHLHSGVLELSFQGENKLINSNKKFESFFSISVVEVFLKKPPFRYATVFTLTVLKKMSLKFLDTLQVFFLFGYFLQKMHRCKNLRRMLPKGSISKVPYISEIVTITGLKTFKMCRSF